MDMRIEFEAAMAKQLSSEGYSDFSIEMMFERGSDDEYRSIRVNGAYWGWQSSRESLVVALPDPFWPGYVEDDEPGLCISTNLFTIEQITEALDDQGIRTK